MKETHRALSDVVGCWELLVKLNEEEPVDSYINQLGYLTKYGPPLWYPSYASERGRELLDEVNRSREEWDS
jgi:DNA polymerase-3 subunit epsilon